MVINKITQGVGFWPRVVTVADKDGLYPVKANRMANFGVSRYSQVSARLPQQVIKILELSTQVTQGPPMLETGQVGSRQSTSGLG